MKKPICLVCALGIMLSFGLSFGAGDFSWPMLVSSTAGSEKVQNRIKTENLDGCWAFKYTIEKEWTTNLCLDKSTAAEVEPDVFLIYGLDDEDDNQAVGAYWPRGDFYYVRVFGSEFEEYFTFQFISSSTVSGEYYIIDPDDGSPLFDSDMTGIRTDENKKTNLTIKRESYLLKQNEIDHVVETKGKSIIDKKILDELHALKTFLDKIDSSTNKQ